MTMHRTVPSEVEPKALADLIDDCDRLPLAMRPRHRVIDLTQVPEPRRALCIPALTTSFVDDYADYGV